MTGTLVALPKSSDDKAWSPEERALVEASGLVHTDARSNVKTLAERPVVAAFLQHCARTGLDPIARQIYCIARKSKGQLRWQIQISIDGARLVAERSGQYEGQTTPEYTADGITWTQVWLAKEPPKAARVGVYRRGFRDALYAIALWDAYAVYDDVWEQGRKVEGARKLSAMWAKMGPLMLAKCAEMLALRKAFPQDLSGLYSSEEMAQADAAQPPQERPAPQGAPTGAAAQESAGAGRTEPPAPAEDPRRRMPTDSGWLERINAATSYEELKPIYAEIQAAGDLDVLIRVDGQEGELGAYIFARRDALLSPAPTEDVVDAEVVEDGSEAWAPTGEPVTDWPVAQIPNGEEPPA